MANYLQELAQDALCQSYFGHMTGLWFLPARTLSLNTNELMNVNIKISVQLANCHIVLMLILLTVSQNRFPAL